MRAPSSYNTVRTCNCLRFRRLPQLFSTPHCRERLEDGMFLAIPQAAKCQEARRPQGGGRVGPQPPGGSQLTPAFPRVKPVIRDESRIKHGGLRRRGVGWVVEWLSSPGRTPRPPGLRPQLLCKDPKSLRLFLPKSQNWEMGWLHKF